MPTIDFHQHLWPQPFVAALRKRRAPPCLERDVLQLAGEPAWRVDLASHEVEGRLALMDSHGIDVAVVSLQPTLGFDALPDGERDELRATWEAGMLELARAADGRLVALGAGGTVDELPGMCVGAAQLFDLEELAPELDRLAAGGRLLFVHPSRAGVRPGMPSWWPALVDYTAQMQAAWAYWITEGVRRWPTLPVVFAILAGGAPFQLERLWSRGVAERSFVPESVFLETSSYGRRALELCLATFGVGQLLYGSDLPIVDPEPTLFAVRAFGNAVAESLLSSNPSRLLP